MRRMSRLIELIQQHHAGRDPERLALKVAAMRRDAFSFLRGTAFLFNAQLAPLLTRLAALRDAPPAWACGDLHLENFGSYRADNGLVYFDINDFDEARLAPATLDLLRLLSSVRVAAAGLEIDAADAASLCERTLACWADTLVTGKPRWVERDTARGIVGDLLDDLRTRSRADFLDSRTRKQGGRRRLRLDNGKALPLPTAERDTLLARLAEFAAACDTPRYFKPLDVARRISGNASLGLPRYIILVRGEGSPEGNALLDLKFAAPPATLETGVPRNAALRLISIQTRMQAIPNAFLQPFRWQGQDFVLRDLQPAQDRVELSLCKGRPKRLASLLDTQAQVLAWAQLRSAAQAGSAPIADLQAFATHRSWRRSLLTASADLAHQVQRDWLAFCAQA